MEELEEAQMKLQQMLTQRHVAPFRTEAQVGDDWPPPRTHRTSD